VLTRAGWNCRPLRGGTNSIIQDDGVARIGLFGGSFNPVHTGHLILAERAREVHALDKVLFVPARMPPHKPHAPLAPAEDRLKMLELAVAGNERFEVCTLELQREEPSYTLVTVRLLKETFGAANQIVLILGADSVRDMPGWWHAAELARQVEIVALGRPGVCLEFSPDLEELLGKERLAAIRRMLADSPQLDISSTDVRERVQDGRSIRYVVPAGVRDYILEKGLYARR